MLLTRDQVISALVAAGVYRPTWSILDDTYTTLDRAQVAEVYWPGWVNSLPNELTEARDIGGGKSRYFPKWIEGVYDCDDHAADFATYIVRCCAVWAAKNHAPRGGTPLGTMAYIAVEKAGNRRVGGHDTTVFIDHELRVNWFEPADGNFIEPLPIEVASVWEGDLR